MSCPTGCRRLSDYCGSLCDYTYKTIRGGSDTNDYIFAVNGKTNVDATQIPEQLIIELTDGTLQTGRGDSPIVADCPDGKQYYPANPNSRVFYRIKSDGYNPNQNSSIGLYSVDKDGVETLLPGSLSINPQKLSKQNGVGTIDLIFHFKDASNIDVYNGKSLEKLGMLTISFGNVSLARASTADCEENKGICAIRISNEGNPCICNFYGGSFKALQQASETNTQKGWWGSMSIWKKILTVIIFILIIVALAFLIMIGIGIYRCASKK